MIVIDSSALRGVSFPHDAALQMLKLVSKSSGHELAIPEMVLEEYLTYRRIDLRKKVKVAKEAIRDMQAAPWWDGRSAWNSMTVPDVDEAMRAIEGELTANFRLLELTGASAIEALKREARRKAPASTGDDPGGARDASIWLTVIAACPVASPSDVYFVAVDNDFGKGSVRAELADEAPPNLVLCKGLDKVMELLAVPASVGKEQIQSDLAASNVREAVQRAIGGSEVFQLIASSIPGMQGATVMSVGREEMVQLNRGNDAHSFMIGEDRIVTAEQHWSVTRRYSATSPGVDTEWKIKFEVRATVVLQLRPENNAFRGIFVPHRHISRVQLVD